MLKTHYLKELNKPHNHVKKGQVNADVKRVQEWINLWRFYDSRWNLEIKTDGKFGIATEYAVKQFQAFRGLLNDGIVGAFTWMELVRPMREAFQPIPFYEADDIRKRVVAYAHQQEWSKPTELNENEGPWVRAFMDGNEGRDWLWCAGFAETLLDQAYSSMNESFKNHFPDPSYFSCDTILNYARHHNRLVETAQLINGSYLPLPGDMFLLMDTENTNDATHIGFVIDCRGTLLTTIEGNTNDATGSRNGGEVCRRTRDLKNYFINLVKLV